MKKSILVCITILLACGAAYAGLEWKAKMVMSGESKGTDNTIVSQVYAQADSYKQVFESVENENPMYVKGSYWLYSGKDGMLYLVNPENKSYTEMDLNAIFRLGGVMGKLVKIKISNPQVKMEKLGSETILGYPCTHYKLVMDYDSEVKVLIKKVKSHEHVEKEIWSTTKINARDVVEGFRFRDFKSGMEDLDNLIEIQVKAEGSMGFPLKMIQVTTGTDKKGNSKETMRIVQEVLSVGTKTFPASFFEIPAGYEKQKIGFFE